jgi:hypothetical protein
MCREFDASICSNCGGVPLFGCVSCPSPKDWREDLLEEVEMIADMALKTHEDTLVKESRKRYDALLEIRNKIARKLRK